MPGLTITVRGSGLEKFEKALDALADGKARRIYSMALNKTGAKVNTQVKRAVSRQMGVSQSAVVRHGGLRLRKAWPGNLEASIESSGEHMPVKDFRPRQGRKGVAAAPWNTRRTFGGTFLDKAGTAGGHVFKNTGKFNRRSGRRNAIDALWGPAVPKELVRDESAAAFHRVAATELPTEVARAIQVVTKGVVS